MTPAPVGAGPRESVAVVVVTYNSAALLPDLVASLPAGLDGVDWHLVVADNASRDDSVAVARRLVPDVVVAQTGYNAGYAAGINAGVAAARPHTAVLVLNPDVRLGPGCVATLLGTLRTPGTGIVAPRLVDGEGRLILTLRREPTLARALGDAVLGARAGRYPRWGEMVSDETRYAVAGPTDWAEGSTLLVSAECWQACGGWDESFFLYSEETDFALRARDAGLVTRYEPAARAVHLEGEGRTSPQLWTIMVLNKVRLYRRRHHAVAAAAFWAAVLLREASRAVLGSAVSRAAVRALVSPSRLRRTPSAADVVPPATRTVSAAA